MELIIKEELIQRLKNSEMFNTQIPKWVWGVIDGIPNLTFQRLVEYAELEEQDAVCNTRV